MKLQSKAQNVLVHSLSRDLLNILVLANEFNVFHTQLTFILFFQKFKSIVFVPISLYTLSSELNIEENWTVWSLWASKIPSVQTEEKEKPMKL